MVYATQLLYSISAVRVDDRHNSVPSVLPVDCARGTGRLSIHDHLVDQFNIFTNLDVEFGRTAIFNRE